MNLSLAISVALNATQSALMFEAWYLNPEPSNGPEEQEKIKEYLEAGGSIKDHPDAKNGLTVLANDGDEAVIVRMETDQKNITDIQVSHFKMNDKASEGVTGTLSRYRMESGPEFEDERRYYQKRVDEFPEGWMSMIEIPAVEEDRTLN